MQCSRAPLWLFLATMCHVLVQSVAENIGSHSINELIDMTDPVYPQVRLSTEHGDIDLQLRVDVAPQTCAAVLDMIKLGLYKKAQFYRADKDYVLQGGMYPASNPKYGSSREHKIPLEATLPNTQGSVAMARWEPLDDGNGEFFINMRDNHNLDKRGTTGWEAGFAVFAEVVRGMNVATKLNRMGPLSGSHGIPMKVTILNE